MQKTPTIINNGAQKGAKNNKKTYQKPVRKKSENGGPSYSNLGDPPVR